MVFVDTNVIVAALNILDHRHAIALPLLQEAWEKASPIYLSNYILAESLAAAWRETQNQELVFKIDETLQSKELRMFLIDETVLTTAKIYMRKFPGIIHTLTDWTSLVICRDEKIDAILSFDRGFDDAASKIPDFQNIRRIESAEQLGGWLAAKRC